MKTIKECFDAARQQFVESHPDLLLRIQQEAVLHAKNIATSECDFIDNEIGKHFVRYLLTYGKDTAVTVIKMTCHDGDTRDLLLKEHYTKVAESAGSSFNEYARLNNINL
ncbi:TPA: hypothetical protein U5D93_003707 [Yersinia enterocolitica]|uniref:DUF6388 family protein n=1 Tax=Yersinia vastinensis TaxID=2890318 RepID=UPI0011A2DEE6|nr:DUF6388 family protein [Yersinia vastinensis]HEN3303067.1 hypothetical protein [Yersinia enterocolitica]HEN3393582.1 hypothetical protein [Yersinia enterocolitica]